MNRNRRDRDGGRRGFGGGGGMDGLLGEGPGGGSAGGMMDPISQMNQLMLAQQLLQKQAALSAGGGDFSTLAGAMNMQHMLQQQQMQQQQQHHYGGGGDRRMHHGGGGGGGGDYHHYNNRKRVGVMDDRDMDSKRRRRSGDFNRGGDGRDRGRSGRRDQDNRDSGPKGKGKKANEEYDPAEPTEDDHNGQASKDKDGNMYCHVCSVSVYDDASFKRHLNGTKHKSFMNSVLSVHQMKSSQLQSRLKAEEHLRKIEGKAGGFDPDYFCKICNNDLTIPWERHRFSNIHKQRQLQVKRGCGWCGVHDFNNFTDVLDHRETDDHKKNADLQGKKRNEPQEKKALKQQHSGSKSKHLKKKKEEEEDLTIPEYNAENAVGRNYIVQVTGYFCKLCNKFYNNEKSAKNAHCQSEAHYEKFKAATEEKIAARAERKKAEEEEEAAALAAAKLAEESEEKMDDEDEEEGVKKEGGGGTTATEGEDVKREGEEGGNGMEEDYDDALPLEDSDEEGGLVKCIGNDDDDEDIMPQPTESVDDSLLNETCANGSFTYLTGDEAQAHLDKPADVDKTIAGAWVEPLAPMEDAARDKMVTLAEVTQDGDADDQQGVEEVDAAAMQPPPAVVAYDDDDTEDEDMSGDMSGLSQEDAASATVVAQAGEGAKATPSKAARGRGTAKRGRGRGKAKK